MYSYICVGGKVKKGYSGGRKEGDEGKSKAYRTTILVVKVVRMLPNIESEQRHAPFLHASARSLSVRAVPDLELAVLVNQPSPTTAKVANCRIGKLNGIKVTLDVRIKE